jgi:hypothetical protein
MDYRTLVESIQSLHERSLERAAAAVNQSLVLRNWRIGAHIVEFEQQGEDRAQYGQGLLQRLSQDLSAGGVKGTSIDMLERMRRFFRLYPQLAELLPEPLSTGHPISAPVVRKSKRRMFSCPAPVDQRVIRGGMPRPH